MTPATPKIVRCIETRKRYRVIREYRRVVLVTPADRKKALPFTMPREWLTPEGEPTK